MTPESISAVVEELIGIIRQNVEEAAALASAAEACAERGSVGKAVEIANDIDDLTHEASQVLALVTLIRRRSRLRPSEEEPSE